MPLELTTARLQLRMIAPHDAPLYAALWSDPRVHPWILDDGPLPVHQARARVGAAVLAAARGDPPIRTVRRQGVSVGFVSLHATGGEVLALRCAIAPRHQGRGYGREAMAAVLETLDDGAVVEARIQVGHPRAEAALRACGFREVETTPVRRVFRWKRAGAT